MCVPVPMAFPPISGPFPSQMGISKPISDWATPMYPVPSASGFMPVNDFAGGTLRLDKYCVSGTVTQTQTPVTLLYFRAQPEGNGVQTEWATAQEDKASRFVVRRSRDGQVYETIHEQSASRKFTNPPDHIPFVIISHWREEELLPAAASRQRRRQYAMKPVYVTIKTDRPSAVVAPNPASPNGILIMLQQAVGRLSFS